MESDNIKYTEIEDSILKKTDLNSQLMKPFDVGNCSIFICTSGQSIVLLYNKKHVFKKGDVLIANWDMHPVFLTVSKEFSTDFCKMSEKIFFHVFRNISYSFCQFTYNYPIFNLSNDQLHQLDSWRDQLSWINNNSRDEQRKNLITNYLESLMLVIDYEILKISPKLHLKPMPRQLEILREFGSLLQLNVKEHHNVKFYAEKLLITPYYLSIITSKIMRETPKSLIDKQLIQEIKKGLLINTPLKVIADQLHFENTSYLSRFFKRHTQQLPSEFKGKSKAVKLG